MEEVSIASRMKTVELQVSSKIKNQRSGKIEDVFEKLADTDVDINFSHMTKLKELEKYKDCDYVGTTTYSNFDLTKSYRIVNGLSTYDVVSINQMSRYTQLIMKAVIKDG